MSQPNPQLSVAGWGAVSPAGYGAEKLGAALLKGSALPSQDMVRALGQGQTAVPACRVPAPAKDLPMPRHPRLRRASPITKFATYAAWQALGEPRVERIRQGSLRVGVIASMMNGCVSYTQRFFQEVLANPATASPLVFPETVFSAPASHLSAWLNNPAPNYTLLGDTAGFLEALMVAADWLQDGWVDGCLVVAAEELDWLTAEGLALYPHNLPASEGAAALYLEPAREDSAPKLVAVSGPISYSGSTRLRAGQEMRHGLPRQTGGVLVMSLADEVEKAVWADWPGAVYVPGRTIGAAMGAASALQCVAALELLREAKCDTSVVSAFGNNGQVSGAIFTK